MYITQHIHYRPLSHTPLSILCVLCHAGLPCVVFYNIYLVLKILVLLQSNAEAQSTCYIVLFSDLAEKSNIIPLPK